VEHRRWSGIRQQRFLPQEIWTNTFVADCFSVSCVNRWCPRTAANRRWHKDPSNTLATNRVKKLTPSLPSDSFRAVAATKRQTPAFCGRPGPIGRLGLGARPPGTRLPNAAAPIQFLSPHLVFECCGPAPQGCRKSFLDFRLATLPRAGTPWAGKRGVEVWLCAPLLFKCAPLWAALAAVLAAAVPVAHAAPLPQPKVGQCPSGYRESGGYCAPTSGRARLANGPPGQAGLDAAVQVFNDAQMTPKPVAPPQQQQQQQQHVQPKKEE
jgi:hypothetical protein